MQLGKSSSASEVKRTEPKGFPALVRPCLRFTLPFRVMDVSTVFGNTNSSFPWSNVTQYIPSGKDLLLVGPRMGMKIGSFFLALPEAIDGVLGGRVGQRIIPEATSIDTMEALTTAGVTAQGVSQIRAETILGADQRNRLPSRFSMESAQSLGNVFSYATSKWSMGCVIMTLILNRTQVYASTRRNLTLGWKVRLAIRIVPIILLITQARWFLQTIHCQTSPNFGLLRWGNSSRPSEPMFSQSGGPLHSLSFILLFGASDSHSCRGVHMIPIKNGHNYEEPEDLKGSVSLLWPLFKSLCLSQFTEAVSCAVQGRQVAAETSMTLFETSLAFAEAEGAASSSLGWSLLDGTSPAINATSEAEKYLKRSMKIYRRNTPPEVLLIGFLSIMSHLTSHILGIFNLQNRLRLVSTAFWGLCFMMAISSSILSFAIDDYSKQSLLKFPTVCVIGFIPHVLVLAGIILCALIYGFALLLTVLAPPNGFGRDEQSLIQKFLLAHNNMQANITLSHFRVSMHMDFYTALLKTGFSALTMASEAVYLRENLGVKIIPLSWLEEERLREIEENGLHLGSNSWFFGDDDSIFHGMTGEVNLVATKLPRERYKKNGFAREQAASKVGKSKTNSRAIRDVDASSRSGRWIPALEIVWGIVKVLAYWLAIMLHNILCRAGIRDRPRWLLSVVRRQNLGSKSDKGWEEKHPSTPELWMLGNGELLPKDGNVDVEVEMRKRFKGSKVWDHSDEMELESSLYGWWLAGGWWGEKDSSGTYKPETQDSEEDTTSVMSTTSEQDWESDDDGQRTPTRQSPQLSREGTPIFDTPLCSSDLASLLDPKTPEHRADAQLLAAHFTSSSILTRSRYRVFRQRERIKVLSSRLHHSERYSGMTGKPTSEEEAEMLEQLIISRRSHSETAPSVAAPASWFEGAPGMGESGPQCVVCQSAPRVIILWPCRCLSLCDDCRVQLAMKNFDSCPCCRHSVSSYSRVFVP